MPWNDILRQFRGRERGISGLYKRRYRNWIRSTFRENWEKREVFWEKYDSGLLSREEFVELLETASQYILQPERDEYEIKFVTGTLSEEDVNYILRFAFPDMFYLKDMVISVGGNPELRKDYNMAIRFFMKERKTTEMVLRTFWESPEYQDLVNNGHTEKEVWQKFMDAAIQRGVYPVYCDPEDNKYKLLNLNAYVFLLARRNQSIATEVLNKAKEFQSISGMFPSVKELLPATNGEVERLQPFETLKLNPPHYQCPLCNHVFKDETFLTRHLVYKHKAQK